MAKARLWQWTINLTTEQSTNGCTEPTRPALEVGDGSRILYYKYQKERGEQGRVHLQGCLRLKNPLTLDGVKRLLGVPHVHLEIARDWQKLREYCGKADTRVEGPWEEGDEGGGSGKRTDLDRVFDAVREHKTLDEIAEEFPAQWIRYHKGIVSLHSHLHPPTMRPDVKVYCFFGATGCGKTRKVMEVAPTCYPVFCMKSPWFDGYVGQKVMLLDDYGPNMFNINFLKRLLDRYPMTLPIKGGSVAMQATTIFITTNYMMSDWYPKAGGLDYDALVRRIEWINFEDLEMRARWQNKWDTGNAAGYQRAAPPGHATGAGAKRRAEEQLEPTQVVDSDEE